MVKANTGFWIHTRRGQRRLRLFRGITATLLMLLISFPVCAVPPVRFAASKDSPTLIRDPGAVAGADFNGDGKMDVAVGSFMLNSLEIMAGAADGTFHTITNYHVPGISSRRIATTDLNHDKTPDIA